MMSMVSKGSLLEDVFAKRNAWRVLRVLVEPPFVAHSQREIGRGLHLPNASVQRGLKALIAGNLARQERGQYVARFGQDAVRYLWLLIQVERQLELPAELRNALDLLPGFDGLPGDACLIVFGSWARGLAVASESDVDVAVFTEVEWHRAAGLNYAHGYRFEIHNVPLGELSSPQTTIALDALLNGIPLRRREIVFDSLVQLRSFPKRFLIRRLEQAETLLTKGDVVKDDAEAHRYYSEAAERAIGQVNNILRHGRTMSWRETRIDAPLPATLRMLRQRLADEGERIWLT